MSKVAELASVTTTINQILSFRESSQ